MRLKFYNYVGNAIFKNTTIEQEKLQFIYTHLTNFLLKLLHLRSVFMLAEQFSAFHKI